MAKFNIEVNLDWLDEEGNIDEVLRDEITSSIVSKVAASAINGIEDKVNAIVNERVEGEVSDKLNALLEDFFTKPRTITDRYGDTVKTDISVIDLLKQSCDEFINGRVDKNGDAVRGSYYGDSKPRIDYIVDKKIDFTMTSAIDRATEQIQKKMMEYINSTVKEKIGDNIAKAIGLEKILK